LEVPGVHESIILKLAFKNMTGCELDSIASGERLVAGSYEHGNKFVGYIKARNFLAMWATIIF
jgi:hypothetical protein